MFYFFMHYLNKLRDFPEYYDMVLSAETLVGSQDQANKHLIRAFGQPHENFVLQMPQNVQQPYKDLVVCGRKLTDAYTAEQRTIGPMPKDMSIFIGQLQELNKIRNNAMALEAQYRKARGVELKLKEQMHVVKQKKDMAKFAQVAAKHKEAKANSEKANNESQLMRTEYISKSDKYRVEFASQLSTVLVALCEARKKTINDLKNYGDELVAIAQKFESADPEIDTLKAECPEFGFEYVPKPKKQRRPIRPIKREEDDNQQKYDDPLGIVAIDPSKEEPKKEEPVVEEKPQQEEEKVEEKKEEEVAETKEVQEEPEQKEEEVDLEADPLA